jgi:hypothetical protein
MNLRWDQRPRDVAYLLNPAFCGEIMRGCIKSYQKTAQRPMPFPLLFLILPIVLHKSTREVMPQTARIRMYSWLQANPQVKVGFAQRARTLLSASKETLVFMMQFGVLTVDNDAMLSAPLKSPKKIRKLKNGEVADCFKRAELLGKWFANSGSSISIYTMWGIKP